MSTLVIEYNDGWYVIISMDHLVVDEAGPFDTENEAMDVESRCYQ